MLLHMPRKSKGIFDEMCRLFDGDKAKFDAFLGDKFIAFRLGIGGCMWKVMCIICMPHNGTNPSFRNAIFVHKNAFVD